MNLSQKPKRCWVQRCKDHPSRESPFYCDDHWKELIEYLVAAVRQIGDEAREVYIGRTNYPERRLLEHFVDSGRDNLAILHWSGSPDEIRVVESEVIKRASRAKLKNLTSESDGSLVGAWNCVYLSWADKYRAKGSIFGRCYGLDDLAASRVWPDLSDFPQQPLFLFADLPPEAAAAMVGDKETRRRFYLQKRERSDTRPVGD